MLPKEHVILGVVFSFIAWLLFPEIGFLGALLIFLSSVFIDVDHYMIYVIKTKEISLKKSYSWWVNLRSTAKKLVEQKKKVKGPICIFHTIEFIFVVFLLSLLYKPFFLILAGIIFHSIVDIIDLKIRKVLYLRELSFINYLINKKSKKVTYL